MSKVIIATAQSRVSKSVVENGIEIRKLIRKGHESGANIIHFCEGALSGYAKSHLINPNLINFEEIRKEINLILTLSKLLKIWVIIGSAHELSKGNKPHNSMYVISDEGIIVNRYDKRKLSHNELSYWYTPGFDVCTFEVMGVKFSCALCIEIQFPELFTEAVNEDIHCILFSSYSRSEMFGIQAQGYAATNNYWISMAIPANESELLSSQLIGPDGNVQSSCDRNVSSIIINEIDLENKKWNLPLKLARPWRRLAREGNIYNVKRVDDVRSKLKTSF